MLLYEKIDISEGIDFNKTDKRMYDLHYSLFKDKNFNFEKFSVIVFIIFESCVLN